MWSPQPTARTDLSFGASSGKGRTPTGTLTASQQPGVTMPKAPKGEGTPLLKGKVARDPITNLGSKRTGKEQEKPQGKHKEDHINTPELAVRCAVLAGLPLLLYTFTLVMVVAFYNEFPLWVFIIYLLTVLKSYLAARFFRNRRWHGWLGKFLAAATTAGLVIGLIWYYWDLIYFYIYQAAKVHINVAANEDVLRFAHSGLLTFTPDARVDASRSVGFQSVVKDAKICVAPVVDSTMSPEDPISFFAVGINCCDWRQGFRCDDSGNVDAHGAALWLFLSNLVSPVAARLFEDHTIQQDFQSAVSLQQAVYSTVLANHTRFLRWVKDPVKVEDAFLQRAVVGLLLWSFLFSVLLLLAAMAAAAGPRQVRKFLSKTTDTEGSEGQGQEVIRTSRPGKVPRTEDWMFQWL